MRKITLLLFFTLGVVAAMARTSDDYTSLGGMLKRPHTQRGRITIINACGEDMSCVLRDAAAEIESQLKFQVDVEPGSFELRSPRLKSEAAIFVVNDPSLPTLLSAPENRWSVANVAPLATKDASVFNARVKKEIVRAFALLGGAFMSQFPNPLVGCVTSVSELDAIDDCTLPIDSVARIKTYFTGYNLAPYEPASYVEACEEGWAPAPTNAVQKEIWKSIHTPPEKPIKITYDKDKQKPVVK